jgi:diguanylate cyclase (GGDEF)-like protein
MDAIQTLLFVIVIQMALAGAGWWLAGAVLGLSRSAALHWSAFCFLGVLTAGAAMANSGPRLAVLAAVTNLALIAAFVAVVRGVAVFLGRRLAVWPEALCVFVVLLVGGWDVARGVEPAVRSLLVSAALAAVLMRGALSNARLVNGEFGAGLALLVAGPMFLMSALFAWRFARAAWFPVPVDQVMLTAPTSANVAVLLMLTALTALFNLSLACMVVLRLVKRLQHMSRHDSLTKLLNRRALMASLETEQVRVQRGSAGWALLLLDIDHFKRVNDRHGHAMGDEVLCRVASVLRRSAREIDTVARMGGEEFCVLAPLTDLHGAALLAERLRQAVAASAEGPGAVPVTISVGVALAGPAAELAPETAEAALARADVALYRAKSAGRDRVELPVADEALPPMGCGALEPQPTTGSA